MKINFDMNMDFLSSLNGLVDFVEISAGSYNDPMKMVDNHRRRLGVDAAQTMMGQYQFKIAATGGFYTVQEAEAALSLKQCEMAGFGRLFCLPEPERVIRLPETGAGG